MEIDVKKIDECRRRVEVSVPADRVEEEMSMAYRRLERTAKVRGFRTGKVPRSVLELRFGLRVGAEVKKRLVSDTFPEALSKKGIEPAGPPSVDIDKFSLRRGEAFRYGVEVEVWPEVRVSGYKGIRTEKKTSAVSEKEVDERIRALRERHAEFLPVEGRALAAGDFAVIDLSAKVGDVSIDEREGILVEIDGKTYLPGFSEKLVGMRPEERRSFSLRLPGDLSKEEFRGEEAAFTVRLREIKTRKIPPLDDEFCKALGSHRNVSELRAAVRRELETIAGAEAAKGIVEQIEAHLLKKNRIPLPQGLVESKTAEIARDLAGRLLSQGAGEKDIIEIREKIRAEARKEAERTLRLAYIFGTIAEREGIEVSGEEVEARVKYLARGMKKKPEELRASMEEKGIIEAMRGEMRRKKVVDFLVQNARIKEKK